MTKVWGDIVRNIADSTVLPFSIVSLAERMNSSWHHTRHDLVRNISSISLEEEVDLGEFPFFSTPKLGLIIRHPLEKWVKNSANQRRFSSQTTSTLISHRYSLTSGGFRIHSNVEKNFVLNLEKKIRKKRKHVLVAPSFSLSTFQHSKHPPPHCFTFERKNSKTNLNQGVSIESQSGCGLEKKSCLLAVFYHFPAGGGGVANFIPFPRAKQSARVETVLELKRWQAAWAKRTSNRKPQAKFVPFGFAMGLSLLHLGYHFNSETFLIWVFADELSTSVALFGQNAKHLADDLVQLKTDGRLQK